MQITNETKKEEYYKALVERDASYLGSFIVGVKTTGIFCIATCRARKPKYENVEFYDGVATALHHGFRPCKICKPTENIFDTPSYVTEAMDLIKSDPKQKVKDYMLRKAGIAPEKLRRWFNKNYGITYHAYQRMYRMNIAYQELQSGKSQADVAYDQGYESLSGFGYTYKNALSQNPSDQSTKNFIYLQRFSTPLGPMYAACTEKGICLLEFTDRRMLESEFADLQKRLKAQVIVKSHRHIKHCIKELNAYFSDTLQIFSVPLDTPGTVFQNTVWEALRKIPFGQTRSYQDQAKYIGNEKANRAVAKANGMNRIAIIIPCHRVIGSDGALTGYGGGLARKEWLLRHEGALT